MKSLPVSLSGRGKVVVYSGGDVFGLVDPVKHI